MRAYTAASAALTVALSGSLALGAAGSALAAGGGPVPKAPAGAARSAAPKPAAEPTATQFLVVEHFGRLTALTGTLGRVARDERPRSPLLRRIQHQMRLETDLVQQAVGKSRPRTLPAPGNRARKSPEAVTFAAARETFDATVDRVVTVDRGNAKARTAASTDLVRDLASLGTAAMTEAGIPLRSGGATAAPEAAPQSTRPAPGRKQPSAAARAAKAPSPSLELYDGRVRLNDDDLFADGVLEGTAHVTDPVGDLVRAALKAPRGRLSDKDIRSHSRKISDAFSRLHRGSTDIRDGRIRDARGTTHRLKPSTVRKMRDHALTRVRRQSDALLRATRTGDLNRTRSAAKELLRTTAGSLATEGAREQPKKPNGVWISMSAPRMR